MDSIVSWQLAINVLGNLMTPSLAQLLLTIMFHAVRLVITGIRRIRQSIQRPQGTEGLMNRLHFCGFLTLSTFAGSVLRNGWFRRIWCRQNTHHQCAVLSLIGLVFSLGLPVETASADTFGGGTNSFEIEFVTIGSPGNPPNANPNPAGAVPYEYRIGKYEISEQMIDKANVLGGLEITKDARGPDKPVTSVNWFEAARFVNWLNTQRRQRARIQVRQHGQFPTLAANRSRLQPGQSLPQPLSEIFSAESR